MIAIMFLSILVKQQKLQMMSLIRSLSQLVVKHSQHYFQDAGTAEVQIILQKGKSEENIVQPGTVIAKPVIRSKPKSRRVSST